MKLISLFKLKLYFHLMILVNCKNIQKKVVRFDRYDICEIGPNKLFNVSYLILKPAGYGSVVFGKFHVFKDIEQVKVLAKITKCARKELLDSCEYVTTLNFQNICGYAALKNTLISPMIYAYDPPLICPVRKGTMVLRNGSLDPTLATFFPIENYYWKIEISLYEVGTGEYIYKLCADGQVVIYRE